MADFTGVAEHYDRMDIGSRVGYGSDPVLVVIDLQKGLTEPERPDGTELVEVISATNDLINLAHREDVPIVFTTLSYAHRDTADAGVYAEKIPALERLVAGTEAVEIDDRLDVRDSNHIIEKQQSSAFAGTELASMLTSWGVDTLILTGFSTSGCIRATAVDGIARGYRVAVPEECVGDRRPEVHESNLFDIDAKCGDVRPKSEIERYITGDLDDAENPATDG